MSKYYIDGAGWNGQVSKVCITKREKGFNRWNKIIIYQYKLTNNEAEYYALIETLKEVEDGDIIYTDSQLLVGQLIKGWKINYKHLQRLVNIAKPLIEGLHIKLIWVNRENNYAGKVLEHA